MADSVWTLRQASGLFIMMICTVLRTYADKSCSAVKTAYASKGFNMFDVPYKMISGEHLQMCPQGYTCCTQGMEHSLSTQSRQEYDKVMANKIGLLSNVFVSRTVKFDAFFTELLDNSKRDLHEMFVRTYGLLYQQNSYVFTDLFKDLRDYYKGKDINLLDALDNFFSTLLQKMFELLNSQYSFDEDYLECVTEHMDDLKPFGDVPQKLSIQVKRAFIAARTFVQGLAVGRDVVLAVSKVTPSTSCGRGLMKMMYCPYCRGMPTLRPCNNYCLNVMKGCLAYHADLNNQWNQYINSMMKLAERLEGPFNIESVVDPIDVKISDAIMNFQENSETVSSKVFSGCGQPRLGRKKRDVSEEDGNHEKRDAGGNYQNKNYQWNDFRNKKGSGGVYVRPTTAAGTNLDRLVSDIKAKIEVAKDFWKDLPHSLCNEMAANVDEELNCWNGQSKARYMPEVIGDGVAAQNNNPEVDVDVRRPNIAINDQILQLKLITNKLKNAYNGLDVDWIDTADVAASGSGSGDTQDDGSAAGSGDNGYKTYDDLSFVQKPWQPPVVQTRRPPQQKNNYNQDNYAYDHRSGGGTTSTNMALLAMVTLLSVFTVRCWQC